MNTAKLTALRERYSPQPIPTCRLCGAEMSAQRISGSRITYACTGATYDDTGCHYAPGRKFVDEHYEQSQVTVVDVSDPDVIELIAALEAAQKCGAELEESELQLMEERDNAEEALPDMYQAATGERPEWSNWFGYADAVDAVTDRVAELEAGINLRRGESNHG
ncbi:ead/Ea22-like family protein [Cronobacter dublinensis]